MEDTPQEQPQDVADGPSSAELLPDRPQMIRALAMTLFDQTQPLHELAELDRQILELAAITIENCQYISAKKSYKSVRKMLKTCIGDDIAPEAEEILAPLILLYLDRIKRKDVIAMDLSPLHQRAVLTLAALLKIAAGLDESRSESTTIVQVELKRDGLWLVVDGPQAETDAAAAEHASSLWEKIGYPRLILLQREEAQQIIDAYQAVPEDLRILPEDPIAEAGRKVMLAQFLAMLEKEEGTRLGEDIEALHDMRVATRRLRAAFEIFGDAFKPKALKPHLKGLRATGRALGAVRDLDVFMEKVGHYLAEKPEGEDHGLDPLLTAWSEQRETARNAMLAYLDSKEYAAFKESFARFLHKPGAGVLPLPKGNPTPSLVRELAPALIYERLAAVRAYDPVIGSAPVPTLHALRIEFKKLRYTVEYFRDVLGTTAKDLINEFKTLQDHLGDLNDAEVAIGILQEFLKSEKKKAAKTGQDFAAESGAIEAYLAYRQAEIERLIAEFPEAWAHFNRLEFMQKVAQAVSVL